MVKIFDFMFYALGIFSGMGQLRLKFLGDYSSIGTPPPQKKKKKKKAGQMGSKIDFFLSLL